MAGYTPYGVYTIVSVNNTKFQNYSTFIYYFHSSINFMKIIIPFFTIFFVISSCQQKEYQDTYGPQVPQGTPPYNLGQVIKFENGSGDTIFFRCSKTQNEEYVTLSPCSQNVNNCYNRYHGYRVVVDLQDFDNTRIFNLIGTSDGLLLGHYINKIPSFRDSANAENIPFPNSSIPTTRPGPCCCP